MLDPRRGPVPETSGFSPNKHTSPYDSHIHGYASLKDELSNRDRQRQSHNSSNIFKRAGTQDNRREQSPQAAEEENSILQPYRESWMSHKNERSPLRQQFN